MTNTYDTAALPLGTTDVKALYNNASNFDEAMNSPGPAFFDRRNKRRQTWAGMESAFETFLQNSGFESTHLTYVDGSPLIVNRSTQLIDRAGLIYRVKMPANFPLTLSGTWATDAALLVDVGDASLRQDLANSVDPTKGVALVAGALRGVKDVATLKTTPGRFDGDMVNLASYWNDWAAYAIPAPKGGGMLIWSANSTATPDDGMIFQVPGVTTGRWLRSGSDGVSVAKYGVKFAAGDRARVQKAIDYCLTSSASARALLSDAKCLMDDTPLYINRPVDTPDENEFRIVAATSVDSGFHKTSSGLFFDSTLPMAAGSGAAPQSEFCTFEGVQFTCSDYNLGPLVLSKKFLRMKFINCFFNKVRFGAFESYAQSFFFIGCNFRAWGGTFFTADYAFDVHFSDCLSEFGAGYLTNFPNGYYLTTFSDMDHEGSVGGLTAGGNAQSLKIDGVYGEGNTLPFFDLSAGGVNNSVNVQSVFLTSTAANVANPSFFEFVWGPTAYGVSIGNRNFNGRLHDNTGIPAIDSAPMLTSIGDSATVAVARNPKYLSDAKGVCAMSTSAGTGSFAFQNFRRIGNRCFIDASFVFGAASGSAVQFINLPYTSILSIFGGRVTLTDQTGEVYIIGGSGSGNSNTGNTFSLCKNRQGTPYTYSEVAGKAITFTVEYQV